MQKVEIYTKGYCPFCHKAKSVLEEHNIKYTEYDVEHNQDKWNEMTKRSSRTTVPQIFSDNLHIGGYDDLIKYKQENGLG